jgi:hypothetical protein
MTTSYIAAHHALSGAACPFRYPSTSTMWSQYPAPTDAKHRLLLYKIEDSILQGMPYDDEKCGTCRFYIGIEDIAYCNHMKLRILVGERWWCQWWEPVEEAEGAL